MSPDRLTSSDTDCWNRIGNRGNRSCPDLPRHIHCRNCPVFSQAARRLLDREPPSDYAKTWTLHYGQPPDARGDQIQSAVLFRLADEWLGITPMVLLEVCDSCPIHILPHQRQKILRGVVNHRGILVICVSLEGLLDIKPQPCIAPAGPSPERLLLLKAPGGTLAAPVQEVAGIHRFSLDETQPPPSTLSRARISYTQALVTWRHHRVALLKPEPLLDELSRCLA